MALRQKYQHAPTALANYDYIDVAEGTGVRIYNGLSISNKSALTIYGATAIKYILTRNTIEGETQKTDGTPTTDDGVSITLDFDLSAFNFPQSLRGTAYVTLNVANTAEGASSEGAMTAQVVNATTSAVIATGYSNPMANSEAAETQDKCVIPITIPLTPFKRGDILRLRIIGNTVGSESTVGGQIDVRHDPTTADYELKFYCPFNLDL